MSDTKNMSDTIQYLPGWRLNRSMEGGLKDCSLIIATYKRPQELLRVLEILIGLADAPAEVVVVDGDAPEEHGSRFYNFLKDHKLPFDCIYAKSPKGLTRQRNVGIDISSHDYVFFLDDDCLPQTGYFREIRKVFLEDVSKKIGGVCGLNINEVDRPLSLSWRGRLALGLLPPLDRPKIYHPSGTSLPISVIKPFSGIRRVNLLNGNAMAFRREVFAESKFSEYFAGYSLGEDVEMSLRIGRKWQIMWCGDARVIHDHAPGGRPAAFAHGVMQVRNRAFIRNRHFPTCHVTDSIRFWLDIVYDMGLDLGRFLRFPWRPQVLLHLIGLMWGSMSSLMSPDSYEEPMPSRQYAHRIEEPIKS